MDVVIKTTDTVTDKIATEIVSNEPVEITSASVLIEPVEYYLTTNKPVYNNTYNTTSYSFDSDFVGGVIDYKFNNNSYILGLLDRVDSLEQGTSIISSSLYNDEMALAALTATVNVEHSGNFATIQQQLLTKATPDDALAIARQAVISTFGTDAQAYVNNIVTSYASENLAYASDYQVISASIAANAAAISNEQTARATQDAALASSITTLSAAVDDVNVALTSVEEVTVSKPNIFRSTTAPTLLTNPELKVNDLWINSSIDPVLAGVIKQYDGTSWVDTNTTAAITASANAAIALTKLGDLEEARDGEVLTLYRTSAPTSGMSYGDYWLDTDSWNGAWYSIYRYEASDGSSTGDLAWHINNGETAKAIAAAYRANVLAGTAQTTADGKVKTWYQSTTPTGLTYNDTGDLWVDTSTINRVVKVWSGSAWVDQTNSRTESAYTWSANASSLITAPDGSVTGWKYANGTNINSTFIINADYFQIRASNQSAAVQTPFAVDTNSGRITFQGRALYRGLDPSYIGPPMVYTLTAFQGALALAGQYFEEEAGSIVVGYSNTGHPGVDICSISPTFDLRFYVVHSMWGYGTGNVSSHTAAVTVKYYVNIYNQSGSLYATYEITSDQYDLGVVAVTTFSTTIIYKATLQPGQYIKIKRSITDFHGDFHFTRAIVTVNNI